MTAMLSVRISIKLLVCGMSLKLPSFWPIEIAHATIYRVGFSNSDISCAAGVRSGRERERSSLINVGH